MNRECPPLEEFEELAALEMADPRRVHLENCPRCRARLTAFRSFMEMKPLPVGVRMDDARRHLTEAIRREAASPLQWTLPRRPSTSWFRFARPIWRPVVGFASALLVVGIFLQVTRDRGADYPPVLRDVGTPQAARALPVGAVLDNGSIQLRWRSIPAAEGYRVLFYGVDLAELLRLEAGSDTTLNVPYEQVARLGAPGSSVFWRVAALQNGDAVSLSPPATLALDRPQKRKR